MKKQAFTAFIFLIILISVNLFAQDSTKAPRRKIAQLSPGLWEITLVPVNILASIGPDGIFIVDANYYEYGKFLKNILDSISGGKKLEYIADTHWHFDHAGGQKYFGNGVKIIAHDNVRKLLSEDGTLLGEVQKAYPGSALPNITFTDSYELKFNGDSIKIISMSGSHSDGDAVVYFRNANVIHIGDIIFADEFPFIDTEHGGNALTMLESIRKIIQMTPSDIKIIPGHGRVYSRSELGEYADIIGKTIEIVRNEKNSGKSLNEIQDKDVLKEYKDLANSFSCSDWIEFVYKSLN